MGHSKDFPEAEGACAILRVPLSTLQRQTEDEGMDLIDVAAKCPALFLTRFRTQVDRKGSLTAEWLYVWASLCARKKPPDVRVITRNLE
jgi:hypothetical protein